MSPSHTLVMCLSVTFFQLHFSYLNRESFSSVKQRIEHVGKVFFGICAPEEIFAKYKYLLKVSDACNWSAEQKCDLSVSLCTR